MIVTILLLILIVGLALWGLRHISMDASARHLLSVGIAIVAVIYLVLLLLGRAPALGI